MADDLLEKAPCGFVLLADNGTILRANSTLTSWLGTTPDELIGTHFGSLLPVGGRVFYQTHVFPLLKLNGHCEEVYLSVRTRDGEEIPTLVNAVRNNSSGSGAGEINYSLVLIPVHQRELYEGELLLARRAAEEANAQLAQANLRLKALDQLKDEMLAVTSHDISGLVTTIRASVQMLMRQRPGSKTDPAQYVLAISDATDRLLVLLRDLSDLALINTGQIRLQPTKLFLSSVAGSAINEATVRAEAKGISLTLETAEDEPPIRADYNRLHQVISNLLGNAIKFTPTGGSVTLRVQPQGDRVALSVADTGVGIGAERLADLLSQFKNTSTPGTMDERGSGLGLAIVRRLVELHGGELEVESVEGAGTTFTVLLNPNLATHDPVPV